MNKLRIILLGFALLTFSLHGQDVQSPLDFTVVNIDGDEVSLSSYRGKVVMIVNVASKCGFTYQYEGLEELYQKYKDQGLVILGFPSNDFLGQELDTDEEIKTFCSVNYGVTFPMFSTISVKGRNQIPLYDYLTSRRANHSFGGRISWNFNKFLVDREGQIINRFGSRTEPMSEEIVAAVEGALN